MKNEFYLILAITLIACNPNLSKRGLEFTHDEKIQYGGYSYLRSGVKEPETVFGLVINRYPYERLPRNLELLNNIQGFEIYNSRNLDWEHTQTVINTLHQIEYLRFDYATFSKLPFLPDSLPSLRKVYLNNLKNLDISYAINQLSELANLEVLGLYDLSYEQIPVEITKCSKLKAIYLASITSLDYQQHFSVFERMNTLETLWIDDANISELPQNFVNLDLSEVRFSYCTRLDYESALDQLVSFKDLETLKIKGSTLSNLPQSIRELTHLKNLHLTYNRQLNLDSLSKDLVYLPNLETLDLASSESNPTERPNQPRYIPENISGLKKLKVLRMDVFRNLDFNQVSGVIKELPSLEEFSFSYISEYEAIYRLEKLPKDFFSGGFNKLKKLDISINGDEFLDSLAILPPSITHLYLNEMYYTVFPEIVYTLPDLESLELRKNELVSLPADISQLESLMHLDLGENQLEDLPDEIAQLKNLKFLHLDENPLVDDTEKVARIKALLPNTIISFYE